MELFPSVTGKVEQRKHQLVLQNKGMIRQMIDTSKPVVIWEIKLQNLQNQESEVFQSIDRGEEKEKISAKVSNGIFLSYAYKEVLPFLSSSGWHICVPLVSDWSLFEACLASVISMWREVGKVAFERKQKTLWAWWSLQWNCSLTAAPDSPAAVAYILKGSWRHDKSQNVREGA